MPAINKPDTANLTRAEYDQEDALSFTGLKELLKSPAHYQHFRTAVREETKALIIGAATHSAVLTPDLFKDAYAMAPECDRRTKEGKAVWEAAQAALKPGQKVLSFDDYQHVMDIADAVTKIWQAGHNAWNETPLFGKTEQGTPIKGIPDCISAEGWIYDLKTTSDTSEFGLVSTMHKFDYVTKMAYYGILAEAAGLGPRRRGILIWQNSSFPYDVHVREIDPHDMDIGRQVAVNRVNALLKLDPTHIERHFDTSLGTISLPDWARNAHLKP